MRSCSACDGSEALLRAAGAILLHDEDALYAKEMAALRSMGALGRGWDRVAVGTAMHAQPGSHRQDSMMSEMD